MNAKHVGFTIEVLQDQGTWSTRTVKKCFVTTIYRKTIIKYDKKNGRLQFL